MLDVVEIGGHFCDQSVVTPGGEEGCNCHSPKWNACQNGFNRWWWKLDVGCLDVKFNEVFFFLKIMSMDLSTLTQNLAKWIYL